MVTNINKLAYFFKGHYQSTTSTVKKRKFFNCLSSTGWRPSGDASVCHSDWSAVWTPSGPCPDQGGLGQCLCRTARYFGEAGERVLLGASQLGADLSLPTHSTNRSRRTSQSVHQTLHWSSPRELIFFSSLKACWPALESAELPLHSPLNATGLVSQPKIEASKGENDVRGIPQF